MAGAPLLRAPPLRCLCTRNRRYVARSVPLGSDAVPAWLGTLDTTCRHTRHVANMSVVPRQRALLIRTGDSMSLQGGREAEPPPFERGDRHGAPSHAAVKGWPLHSAAHTARHPQRGAAALVFRPRTAAVGGLRQPTLNKGGCDWPTALGFDTTPISRRVPRGGLLFMARLSHTIPCRGRGNIAQWC